MRARNKLARRYGRTMKIKPESLVSKRSAQLRMAALHREWLVAKTASRQNLLQIRDEIDALVMAARERGWRLHVAPEIVTATWAGGVLQTG